jgi:hypothetical protein
MSKYLLSPTKKTNAAELDKRREAVKVAAEKAGLTFFGYADNKRTHPIVGHGSEKKESPRVTIDIFTGEVVTIASGAKVFAPTDFKILSTLLKSVGKVG